jgi:predicted Zn-dependent protease
MSEIEPPDSHHLSAAAGWIELGLPDEARQELNRLTPGARNHPDALAIEWDLHARAGAWENALAVATKLVEVDSDRPAGWINRSYALHELRRPSGSFPTIWPVTRASWAIWKRRVRGSGGR